MAVTISNDEELINSCIELLKEHHPNGLTIKQMAQKLMIHKSTLCRSSTVLSTKLNSYYRRCDENCPIIRLQCPDVPNRLMYKYNDGKSMIKKSQPLSPPPTENDPKEDIIKDKLVGEYIERPISPPSPPSNTANNTPTTTTTTAAGPKHNYSLRKVIKKTPHAFTPPSSSRKNSNAAATKGNSNKLDSAIEDFNKRSSSKNEITPAPATNNPYYDMINPSVNLVDSWAWINDEKMENIKSPENITLDDLDELL